MIVYKFQDVVDGRFAFIVAKSQEEAEKTLRNLTSVDFKLVDSKSPNELSRPIVLVNNILPF
jgi:hypothetical protein